jgi:hypothetical protein
MAYHNQLLLLEEQMINEEGLIDECERKKDLGRERVGSRERLRLKKRRQHDQHGDYQSNTEDATIYPVVNPNLYEGSLG